MRTILILAVCASFVAQARAASPEDVQAAIRKARAYIYSRQNKDGTWETSSEMEHGGGIESRQRVDQAQWGGLTALATYSLIVAGESPNEPKLAKAIGFLKSAHIVGTYALSFRCQLWSVLPPDNVVRMKARADAGAMMGGMITAGRGQGFYNYVVNYQAFAVPQWWWDLSNSQIAVLGVWACDKTLDPTGAQIPTSYWQMADQAWRGSQYQQGAWPYSTEDPGEFSAKPRLSITAAGVATLFITDEYLHRNEGLDCKGYFRDGNADTGMGYLADHFHDLTDAAKPDCYAFYGLERIGVASGRRFLQSATQPSTRIDWYQQGGDYLLKRQNVNGSWGKDDAGETFSYNPMQLPDTCFAAIFLSRGRAPVLISKLQYDAKGFDGKRTESLAWNQRQRDVANITRWISTRAEQPLNWQVATLDDPIDDLHQAPILYISGNSELRFTPAEQATLKQFIDEGGTVFGNADCAGKPFVNSFEALGNKLFPEYRFSDLPRNDLLYARGAAQSSTRLPVPLRRLSNGVRNLMLLADKADPARSWQTQSSLDHVNHFDLMNEVAFYATDQLRGVRGRGEAAFPRPDPRITPSHHLSIARLKWNGNWDPEPAGWIRMAALLHNNNAIDLQTQTVDPSTAPIPASMSIADLTGTGTCTLGAAARKNIQDFVDRGGTLLIDAAGGDRTFADSAANELAQVFPATDFQPINNTDAIFPPTIAYRQYAIRRKQMPALETMTIKGRRAVYFSPGDLSAGLVGEQIDGIVGYDPDTATAIMSNLLLSAAKNP